jgi:hypothetical protein
MSILEAHLFAARQQSNSTSNTSSTNNSSNNPVSSRDKTWIVYLILPASIVVFSFMLIMFWAWKYRNHPGFLYQDLENPISQGKPELDGRDIRVEAGHHTHGTELDASLRTELLGCVVASQLLENTTVAVEMGSGSEVYEVSAGSIHQENGGTSPALTRDGLTHSPSNDFSLAVER